MPLERSFPIPEPVKGRRKRIGRQKASRHARGDKNQERERDGIGFASQDAMRHSEFQEKLLKDLRRLHELIIRYAKGDRSVRQERDRLEGSIQVRFALWKAIVRHKK